MIYCCDQQDRIVNLYDQIIREGMRIGEEVEGGLFPILVIVQYEGEQPDCLDHCSHDEEEVPLRVAVGQVTGTTNTGHL